MASFEKRLPAAAGSFYPASKKELEKKLAAFLANEKELKAEGRLEILIVPHAGIDFSGPVAASGFKQAGGKTFKRVILLGASHRAFFEGAAVYPQGSWVTPLGEIMVDSGLGREIIDPSKKIFGRSDVHKGEHSLEMGVIFLQAVLKDFKIVPILTGETSNETLEFLAEKISQNLDKETLLVVSSDLSHYPPYSIANEVDNRTIKAILSGKSEVFEKAVKEIKEENYPGLQTAACGQTPILIALKVAERLKIDDFRKIKYQNSGKMSLEKKQVVGYGAIGAWEKTDSSFLDKEASSIALKISRKTLETHLKGKGFESVPKNPSLLKPLGAFVTLKNQGQLRGCIGEFEPDEPLYRVIQKMSIAAATEDPRFPKVGFEELGEIEIEISVIGPRKKIDDWQKIKLGQEGVALQYGPRAGTFLPQVALETGWSLEEFLSQLCQQKAGLPPHCYKSPEVSLYVFEVQILEEK